MTNKAWMVTCMVVLIGVFLATAAECRGADDPAKVTEGTAAAKEMKEVSAPAKPKDAMFLLRDMGWGDPFVDPRERIKRTLKEDDVIPELADDKKKIWEDALVVLIVEVIIGRKNNLAAVIAGVRVRPGDIIIADKLRFRVERITSDAVHLRCVSEEPVHKKFFGITVKRKILF